MKAAKADGYDEYKGLVKRGISLVDNKEKEVRLTHFPCTVTIYL